METETAAVREAKAGLREALFGNSDEAHQHVTAALALSGGRKVQAVAGLALALAGDSARASAISRNLTEAFPQDTLVQFNYLPTLQAQLAIDRKDPSRALEALEVASNYELGRAFTSDMPPAMCPVYVRGEAYLAARRGSQAAAEFQKILDHPGLVLNEPIGALARLGLARAYALEAGSTGGTAVRERGGATGGTPVPEPEALAKARAAYQDFLTLWKDADPDIPILKQAKAEYARLR